MTEKSLGSGLHITPSNSILYSVDEGDCIGNLYIRAQGPRRINELADTIYHKDAVVPYHEHRAGYETFLIDGGSVEVFINGKTAVLEQGDLVQIRPYIGHGFHLLEEGTIWREMFQEMDMYKAVEEKDVLRTYSPASFGDQEVRQRRLDRAQVEYRDTPVCVRVDKHEIPEVRPKGWALQTFSFPGITLHLKVGRWETDGVKEIWELELQKGTKIDWQIPYGDTDLFLVQSGAVRVQADGDHDFVAREHEIVNIPPFYKHTIAAIEENTRLLAYNVQAHLLRILERLQYERIHTPEGWNDWTHIESVLREFDCWVTGVSCEG